MEGEKQQKKIHEIDLSSLVSISEPTSFADINAMLNELQKGGNNNVG